MEIHLPNSAFLGNIDPFLLGFKPEGPNKLLITANKKWISVHPVVLSMIAALGLSIKKQNIHCEKLEAKSKHYLERMGLFKILDIDSDITINEHEATGRFIPLTQIKNSQSLSKFIQELTPLLHLKSKDAEPIKYIVSELVRNVLEHSASEYGAIVSAQYHAKTKTIRIGIADTGIGIWTALKQSYNPQDCLEAIQLALTPGITGTTHKEGGSELNAGAGLFFTKSIAYVNRSFFMIYSGNAMYKLLRRKSERLKLHADPFADKHSKREDLPFWQGAIVGIDMSLEDTQEFSVLLDLIRETYSQAIQERKKTRLQKPKFI